MQASQNLTDLIELVSILRNECPWDRKQTHESIKDNLIEESYEAIEAIDNQNFDELKKELGDVLLHVVFHSNMAHEKSKFNIGDVIFTLMDKLIRRHPHVFGTQAIHNDAQIAENWENIKLKEGKKSTLDLAKNTTFLIYKYLSKVMNFFFVFRKFNECYGCLAK